VTVRIAIVQPMGHPPPDDERNVADALRHIDRAAAEGARIVTFPESYPGPWRMPAAYDPVETLCNAAVEHGIHVQFGTMEPLDEERRMAHNLLLLAYPDGRAPGVYRRTHPPGPWIYTGGRYWDFEYVEGSAYPVFDTEFGKVGLAMCSEVYMPEVTRALALRGAELIFMPGGIDKQQLFDSWRNLIWSRAIENLASVVTTQNLFDPGERGLAMVAQPERVLFESTVAGMFVVDVDLERCRDLRRQTDELDSFYRNGAKAGILTQWQRPEMYDRFYPRPEKKAAE
jgi:predicted amidohydrolase